MSVQEDPGQRAAGLGAATAWAAPATPAPQEFYFDNDPAPRRWWRCRAGAMIWSPSWSSCVNAAPCGRATATGLGGRCAGPWRAGRAVVCRGDERGPGTEQQWPRALELRLGPAAPAPEAALEQWLASAANARTKPSWVPPTYALALWRMGQKQEAVQVCGCGTHRADARNTTANYAQLLPQWREDERASLAEVQQACGPHRLPGPEGGSAGLHPAPAEATAKAKATATAVFRWSGTVGLRGRRKPIHGAWSRASMRLTPQTHSAPPSTDFAAVGRCRPWSTR